MKATVLIENSPVTPNTYNLKEQHGLSFYIEYNGKKILFDMGQDNFFAKNAKNLDIDLSEVDYLLISHGHYDHGGGLETFLKLNTKAKIFFHKEALNDFYSLNHGAQPKYIGFDRELIAKHMNRITLIDKDCVIDGDIHVIEKFESNFPRPKSNKALFKQVGDDLINDDFAHEIAMVLKEDDGITVFTACSHSGVINMLDSVKEKFPQEKIKALLGGFHIHNPSANTNESKEYIDNLAAKIDENDFTFYTGHCTGEDNYMSLKDRLGDKIGHMTMGKTIET